MSHGDRMDAVEAAFKAKNWPNDFRISTVWYAAHRFAGYNGNGYIGAIDALARKYETAEEIADLPTKAANARA